MEGGPPGFNQDFSCPDLLWILPCGSKFRVQGFHLLWLAFPKPFYYLSPINYAVRNPKSEDLVWPLAISLATTFAISFDFFSCCYLDVSLRNVPSTYPIYSDMSDWAFTPAGFPHSDMSGS